jgi:HSP20 family protein
MSGTVSKRETSQPRRWFERGPLSSLREEMDDLFENFFGTPSSGALSVDSMPSIDVSETAEAIEVKTDLPGIKPENIDIEIKDDYLTISGQTSEEKESEEGDGRKYHRIERRTGSFSRSVRLPCGVLQDKVDAELKDGVLTVTLPKAEEAKAKKINIRG